METLNIKVALDDNLRVAVSGGEYEGNEFVVDGAHDATCTPLSLGQSTVLEIIYKADVQPCIVLGLRSQEFEGANISTDVDRASRLVVAVGLENDNEQYSDPIVDTMLTDSSSSDIEVSLSPLAS